MEKDDHHNYSASLSDKNDEKNNDNDVMVDYMLHNPNPNPHHQQIAPTLDLSFADVMQFADMGPKSGMSETKISERYHESGMMDPVYFLKFPVLNEEEEEEEERGRVSDNGLLTGKKRKRTRTMKTSEEVESQRMTHIAVERNRRKQMNEHLRVLRSLMPGSYVQRGDQASIIGGAIEFVRELEQLLQCLESQKRRRLYAESPPPTQQITDNNINNNINNVTIQQQQPMFPFSNEQIMEEETAESKSRLADVEVKVVGFDAIIKILCRRRAGQLVNTIAALEDMELTILHTNITTIEQTVLYSFNVKVGREMRFTAEDIASSVQQMFTFIHANSTI